MKVGMNNVVNSEIFESSRTGVMEGLRQASTMAPSWTKQIARGVQHLIFQWF